MEPTKAIERVNRTLRGRGRTALYDWFWDHWDELTGYEAYKPSWSKTTKVLTELGLKGRDDRPLTEGMVRMTFMRVKADKEAEVQSAPRAATQPKPQPPAPKPEQQGPADQERAGGVFSRVVLRAADGSVYDPNQPNKTSTRK
jgi:hypothetical protein